VQESEGPEGLRVFYYLVQDLKAFVFSLIGLHFKVCHINMRMLMIDQTYIVVGFLDVEYNSVDGICSGSREYILARITPPPPSHPQ
jgi:hypothetical protein